MKLYTEEQVLKAYKDGNLDGFSNVSALDMCIDSLTPIELPSDEEIGKEMDKLPFSKHIDDGMFNDGQLSGFELGAIWMKEQILNQNKQNTNTSFTPHNANAVAEYNEGLKNFTPNN